MTIVRRLWFVWVAFFSLVACGQEAPTLQVTQWLQAPDGFDGQWSGLRGKVVVLDFWATWCSPCIHAIPHLNQLANEFRDQGVLFLAVTDDDVDRLKPFLAKQPMNAESMPSARIGRLLRCHPFRTRCSLAKTAA